MELLQHRARGSEVDLHAGADAHAPPGLNNVQLAVGHVYPPRRVGAIEHPHHVRTIGVRDDLSDQRPVVVVAADMMTRDPRAAAENDLCAVDSAAAHRSDRIPTCPTPRRSIERDEVLAVTARALDDGVVQPGERPVRGRCGC